MMEVLRGTVGAACRRLAKEDRAIAFVQVGEEELLEKALKPFKRIVEKEGIVREWKRREYFEKPSTVRNKRRKAMERKRLKKMRKIQTQLKR
ncbi:30S ribosomal protein S21 [Geodia barretti]|uniref:30S ribosomal protein S21 n=1 Tax=Geodia barretti TaxID=519541 RepID=A0AA35RFC2_GEOBA|nr:30S ribosomal protein S21 [Geodia barretti]